MFSWLCGNLCHEVSRPEVVYVPVGKVLGEVALHSQESALQAVPPAEGDDGSEYPETPCESCLGPEADGPVDQDAEKPGRPSDHLPCLADPPEATTKNKMLLDDSADLEYTQSSGANETTPGSHSSLMEKSSTAETLNSSAEPVASPAVEARSPDVARADFAGSWILTGVDGDMPGFLRDVGIAKKDREAARRANYGVQCQVQNITQMGDTFVVQNILKGKIVTMRFRVGEGEQESLDQEGKKVTIVPEWDGEGEVLLVRSKHPTGESIAQSRRYFDEASMVIEFASPTGTVMRRIFERR